MKSLDRLITNVEPASPPATRTARWSNPWRSSSKNAAWRSAKTSTSTRTQSACSRHSRRRTTRRGAWRRCRSERSERSTRPERQGPEFRRTEIYVGIRVAPVHFRGHCAERRPRAGGAPEGCCRRRRVSREPGRHRLRGRRGCGGHRLGAAGSSIVSGSSRPRSRLARRGNSCRSFGQLGQGHLSAAAFEER